MFSLRSRNGRSLSKNISPTEHRLSYESQFNQKDSYPQHQNTKFPETPPLSPLSSPCLTSRPSSPRFPEDVNLAKEPPEVELLDKRERTKRNSSSGSTKTRRRLLHSLTLLIKRKLSQDVLEVSTGDPAESSEGNLLYKDVNPSIRGNLVHDLSVSRQARHENDYQKFQAKHNATANTSNGMHSPPSYEKNEHPNNLWQRDDLTPISMEDSDDDENYPDSRLDASRGFGSTNSTLLDPSYSLVSQKASENRSELFFKDTTKSNLKSDSSIKWGRTVYADGSPVSPKTAIPPFNVFHRGLGFSDFLSSESSAANKPYSLDMSGLLNSSGPSKIVSPKNSSNLQDSTIQETLLEKIHSKKADNEMQKLVEHKNFKAGNASNLLNCENFNENRDLKEPLADENNDSKASLASEKFGPNKKTQISNATAKGFRTNVRNMLINTNKHVDRLPMATVTSIKLESYEDPSFLFTPEIELNSTYHFTREIQRSETEDPLHSNPREQSPISQLDQSDFYYDDGMIKTSYNSSGPVEFDESIFDEDDTDQYGRSLTKFSLPFWDSSGIPKSASTSCDEIFSRQGSISIQLDLSSDSEEISLAKPSQIHVPEFHKNENEVDFDDYSQDDDIIAAANAEALANDFDGLYGHEFGFYATPEASEDPALCEIGGYFGPIGLDRTNKCLSSRHGSHEPSLSPITERSEYSNRNSYMSLNIHSPELARCMVSPGLGQLSGLLSREYLRGNISFESLLSQS